MIGSRCWQSCLVCSPMYRCTIDPSLVRTQYQYTVTCLRLTSSAFLERFMRIPHASAEQMGRSFLCKRRADCVSCARIPGLIGVGLNSHTETILRAQVRYWWVSFRCQEMLENFMSELDGALLATVQMRVVPDKKVKRYDCKSTTKEEFTKRNTITKSGGKSDTVNGSDWGQSLTCDRDRLFEIESGSGKPSQTQSPALMKA